MRSTIIICQECSTRNHYAARMCAKCGNGLQPEIEKEINLKGCRFCRIKKGEPKGAYSCENCRIKIEHDILHLPLEWKGDKNATIMGMFLSRNLYASAAVLRHVMKDTHKEFPITRDQYIFFIDKVKGRSHYDQS